MREKHKFSAWIRENWIFPVWFREIIHIQSNFCDIEWNFLFSSQCVIAWKRIKYAWLRDWLLSLRAPYKGLVEIYRLLRQEKSIHPVLCRKNVFASLLCYLFRTKLLGCLLLWKISPQIFDKKFSPPPFSLERCSPAVDAPGPGTPKMRKCRKCLKLQ